MFDKMIYDLGVNHGEDSAFYLEKGFKVIGFEANPDIYQVVRTNLSAFIESGQYILLNQGVWHEATTLTFYQNLDNHHWSSFDKVYGCRNNTKYNEIKVNCEKIENIIKKFGTPYYMKIDIEGADKYVLRDLKNVLNLPKFISVEEYGFRAIDDLHALGYQKFCLTPQRNKEWATSPNPPKEGKFVSRISTGLDSGLFGEELPFKWQDYDSFRGHFLTNVRNEKHKNLYPDKNEWFDIHATKDI